MKIYLALSSRSGTLPEIDAIPGSIEKVVFQAKAGPWHHRVWTSRDGAVRLIGWSNEPEEVDLRFSPILQTDQEAAIGYPGYLGPGARLRRPLDVANLAEVDDWSGVFGVFRADQTGFHALTTACRLHPVFHGATADLHVAGSRALLVHGVLRAIEAGQDARPSYDVAALEVLVRSGYFMGEDTPFSGVKALPAHSTLRVEGGRATIQQRRLPESARHPGALRERIDDLAEALVAAVTPLRDFPDLPLATLTGGRDSRLVASTLRAAGVSFSTYTGGFPDHPDVVLAARVAKLLGVPHQTRAPQRDASGEALVLPHPLVRTWNLLRATDGFNSAFYNVKPLASFTGAPRLCGAGGEQLRGGFMTKLRAVDRDAARATLRKLILTGKDAMTEASNARASERLRQWEARDPFEALDLFYLYDRSGRWSSPGRTAARSRHATFDILFDNRVTRGALAIPATERWSERPIFELIARLAPALRDVPLIGRRWLFDQSPLRLTGRAAWRARAPVPAPDAQASGFDWRDAMVTPSVGPHFRDQILGGPAALFEVVDRARIEALVGRPSVGRATAQLLWGAYTASVLLSGEWLRPRKPAEPDVRVDLPERLRRSIQGR